MNDLKKQGLSELADAAFEQAARKVIERAIQTGTPLIMRQDGVVKEVDPKTVVLRKKEN